MKLRIFVEPQQGASYEDQLQLALVAEEEGFDAFFRSDHFLKMGPRSGLPGPTDAWLTLAGLARETTTIRLGTLVTSATFRAPGLLAVSVAQVDDMSRGRVELGIGAGWYKEEHDAHAVDFPSLAERFVRLEEQLAIITGMWATPEGAHFDFDGTHFSVTQSPALPKPIQRPGPPLIIGGAGPSKTPRLAALYASEFNTPFLSPKDAAGQFQRVDEACEAIGRDPKEVRHSSAVTVVCAEDDATLSRRVAAAGWSRDDLEIFGACGTPHQVAEKLLQWRDAGAETAYLQILDMGDTDHLRLIAREVAPLLA